MHLRGNPKPKTTDNPQQLYQRRVTSTYQQHWSRKWHELPNIRRLPVRSCCSCQYIFARKQKFTDRMLFSQRSALTQSEFVRQTPLVSTTTARRLCNQALWRCQCCYWFRSPPRAWSFAATIWKWRWICCWSSKEWRLCVDHSTSIDAARARFRRPGFRRRRTTVCEG